MGKQRDILTLNKAEALLLIICFAASEVFSF